MRRRRTSPQIRFWKFDRKTRGCWLWQGGTTLWGYGTFYLDLKHRVSLAHRVAYAWLVGRIPSGKCVLHACDNPPCVRVSHLFIGTHADNSADKVRKGRGRNGGAKLRGEGNPRSKVTATQVREIRRRYSVGGVSQIALGREYGLAQPTISHLLLRDTWKDE